MRPVTLLALPVVVLLAPDSVRAQAPGPTDTHLQIERQQRRVTVGPGSPADVVDRDVEAANTRVQQHERQEHIARDLRHALPRRPDLDYDVKNAIQSQRLNDVLRR